MAPTDGGSFLTFAIAARLWDAGSSEPWLGRATDWCWSKLESSGELSAYWLKFSLDFLDHVPDQARASATIDRLRSQLGTDGSIRVPGGTENERLTPLVLSPRPECRSRALFTDDQVDIDLDLLEREQQVDGGWTFDWFAWSPGQSVEWRGILTVRALATLATHGRIRPHGSAS
jgi:hypothetical protein